MMHAVYIDILHVYDVSYRERECSWQYITKTRLLELEHGRDAFKAYKAEYRLQKQAKKQQQQSQQQPQQPPPQQKREEAPVKLQQQQKQPQPQPPQQSAGTNDSAAAADGEQSKTQKKRKPPPPIRTGDQLTRRQERCFEGNTPFPPCKTRHIQLYAQ
jgi:hypothetical protein